MTLPPPSLSSKQPSPPPSISSSMDIKDKDKAPSPCPSLPPCPRPHLPRPKYQPKIHKNKKTKKPMIIDLKSLTSAQVARKAELVERLSKIKEECVMLREEHWKVKVQLEENEAKISNVDYIISVISRELIVLQHK
ncbi:hypothetical protein FQN55_004202 [Onygenales sp. PD_40]|nr:hypothetical protein FQN55_004202 [Onygenales sp. PD_40]